MLTLQEKKEVIELIKNGMDPILLSLELEIPEEEMEEYKKEANATNIVKQAEKKSRKKKDKNKVETLEEEEVESTIATDYAEVIERTKQIIRENGKKNKLVDMNKRNFLAYTYFSSGDIDLAKQELEDLIEEYQSIMSYRQMAYIEKKQGNLEDAKLWVYEAMEYHPQNTELIKQLIRIDEALGDIEEATSMAEELVKLTPQVAENQRILESLKRKNTELER